jgi:geranylgeranylglycerol-phosphate geranylgeranyltransferase
MVSSIKPYISILRPGNVLITFLSVLTILLISDASRDPLTVGIAVYAAFSAGIICGGGNIINDYFDIEIDRINRPERVMVQGLVSKNQALGLWFLTSATGLFFSYLINPACFVIAFVSIALLVFYSSHLKRTPLLGNVTVGFFTALAFIYGGIAIGKLDRAAAPAVFSFLFHCGREILKDVEDKEGDRKSSAKTFPIVYGVNPALLLVTLIFVTLIIATVKAFLMGYYHERYLWVVLFGVHPVLAFTIFSMWRDPSSKNLHVLNNVLKWDMIVGLLAIYLGS